ncbi:MAG: hypothetical protein JO112_08425 [Planctomycetes bacterium]|nr:hypothetical protein [Planctomycetota bacterium]
MPYHLQVVLHVARHRSLTDVFREQIGRELHDWLQAALGPMGEVEIINTDRVDEVNKDKLLPALLQEVEAKGLQQALDAPPADWKKLRDLKTHFVLVDYLQGRYEIQTRQFDGLTGLASPVVRHDSTFDRQLVARTAARLIDEDIGVVGTLEPGAKGPEVKITLQAGGLGVPLEHWVKKDDVFQVAQVLQGGKGLRSFRVEWALLQVTEEPKEGVCTCLLYARYSPPLPSSPAIVGFRCLKLGTTTAPLRLRLVDEKNFAPLSALRVKVSPFNFDAKVRDDKVDNSEGIVQTDPQNPYPNIAFVRVLNGEIPLARVPVPIFADHTVVCPILPNAETATLADLELRRTHWVDQLYDTLSVASQLFKDLRQLVESGSNEEALKKAQSALSDLDAGIAAGQAERTRLQMAIQQANSSGKLNLAQGEQLLQDLDNRKAKLQDFIANVQKVIAEKNDPNRAKWLAMIQQAHLLEDEANYEGAIELYQQVIKELKEGDARTQLQKHLDEVQQAWKIKSPDQESARKFIYDVWPKLATVRELKENMDRARSAFDACKAVGDRLTLRKLLLVDVNHAANLKKDIDQIKGQDTEDARQEIKLISEVSTALEKLHQDVSNYVQPPKTVAK